ncbi:pyruvate ferredoxin oxidoreductase [Geoglobus sp.]
MRRVLITGNRAAALAARDSNVDVVAAYPITPSTPVVEDIARMVESGEMGAKLVLVESEHSAMAACIGASASGSRVFTATSSHGLAYMHELLHYAANARTPVVMAVANRAIGPGWNIWADLSDAMSQRDTGWIQIYCSSSQEIYDTIIMAYKVAEDRRVSLPAMVCYDGFVLSHTAMPVEVGVEDFLGEYNPPWNLNFDSPETFGNILPPDYYMELRRDVFESHVRAIEVMKETEDEFESATGRRTPLIAEEYMLEDAETAVVAIGAMASEAKLAVMRERKKGRKVGLLRIRSFRPFPSKVVADVLGNVERVVVLDRSVSPGSEGHLFSEIKSSLYTSENRPEVLGRIAGLGGRDVTFRAIEMAAEGEFRDGWIMEVVL